MTAGTGPVAFVLGGGGSLGAAQVGMLRALLEHGVAPDLVVGCSVGALNGGALAVEPTLAMVDRLQEIWLGLDDRDLLPGGLVPTVVQMTRRGEAVHGNEGLRQVIEEVLPGGARFEDLAVPFQCVATEVVGAREVWFSTGSPVLPILASAAIPAVLPPVDVDGVRCVDGAVVNAVPVARAVELGARTVYVLHVGAGDAPRDPSLRRPLDAALHAYSLARRARLARDLAALDPAVEVVLLPPGDAARSRFNDFSHSAALISSAHQACRAALTDRPTEPVGDGGHAAG